MILILQIAAGIILAYLVISILELGIRVLDDNAAEPTIRDLVGAIALRVLPAAAIIGLCAWLWMSFSE